MNLEQQLQDFIHMVTNAHVVKILLFEDKSPSFQKEALPFQCKYCYSVTIVTNQEAFLIQTQESVPGISTFSIATSPHQKEYTSHLDIDSNVKSARVTSGHHGVAARIDLQFASQVISLYAAEIYDSFSGNVRYALNDEMILFFDSEKDAGMFEQCITND